MEGFGCVFIVDVKYDKLPKFLFQIVNFCHDLSNYRQL